MKSAISDTRNKGDEATPVHGGQYPHHVRETTLDDDEEDRVVKIVRILWEKQKAIKGHLSRQDQVMTELRQALSHASNNANR